MDVNQMYVVTRYAVGKNVQNGTLSPEDFYRIINLAQVAYLDYLLGEYQQYQAGRPIAVVEFSNKDKIRQSFAPLIYNITLTVTPSTGIAAYPSDFEKVDAMMNAYNLYNIKFVQQPRLASFIQSKIDPVTPTNPIYLVQHEGFHFYPETIGNARLTYVRTPPSIVWGYTEDSNGIPVYNPATSQQPVWADYDCFNIIVRALQLIGVNLQMDTVINYASQIKGGGQ